MYLELVVVEQMEGLVTELVADCGCNLLQRTVGIAYHLPTVADCDSTIRPLIVVVIRQ